MKHTKGEWKYYLDYEPIPSKEKYTNGWFKIDSSEHDIIGIAQAQFYPNDGLPKEEAEANAKLIAQSPIMYKLIKELDRLKYYITIESDFTDDWNKLQKELEAIQKATP